MCMCISMCTMCIHMCICNIKPTKKNNCASNSDLNNTYCLSSYTCRMSPIKRSTKGSGSGTNAKRYKQITTTAAAHATLVDVAALTAEITKTVTNTVMESLRQAGLLNSHSRPPVPATDANNTEQITAPVSSENVIEANFLDSEMDNSGVTDINNTTTTPQTTSLTSSSCKLGKSRFVSSRVPLHANVP